MIYSIVVYGDPVLRQKAKPIAPGTLLQDLIQDMFDTMHGAQGIGLAAPQIGKSIRLFVVDGSVLEGEEEMEDFKKAFINPEILEEEGNPFEYEEGCLSIPSIREKIKRQDTLTLRYFDEQWEERKETFSGLKARIIQHEYDHLEGKLFIDYLTPLKKKLLKGKLKDISKGKVDTDYRIKIPK